MERTLFAWSSGKDSAWALHVLRQRDDIEVVGLLTTLNAVRDRVAMHAVSRELLEHQAEALGLPLWRVPIPEPCPNEAYEAAMADALARARDAGVTRVAFGDLFLADVRAYRERQLSGTGIVPLFPLWGRDTARLAREMLAGGLRARLVCVDPRRLAPELAGREFDARLLDELPSDVDPLGERGEFHTFAWDAPGFAHPIPVQHAGAVDREGFVFSDLRPASAARPEP